MKRKENEYYNQLQKESSHESRFVLVVFYYGGPPICLGGDPFYFTNQDPTLRILPMHMPTEKC